MFMEICFVFIREILLIPLVISKKPVIIGLIKEVSICKMLKRGIKSKEKLCNKPLSTKNMLYNNQTNTFLNVINMYISEILEKITTNPPISKIV